MTGEDAVGFLSPAISRRGGVWADLGAGDGTFTRALAQLLGPGSQIYAVDRDASAVSALEAWAPSAPCTVVPVMADFSLPFDPPRAARLDGMLFANSLHYVRDAASVLARLAVWLEPGGRVVIIEYDRRRANRWVPFPIAIAALPQLTTAAGLVNASVVGTRSSIYEGDLYVAVADRPADAADARNIGRSEE
jgi:SAM-dependent methyltransferase